MMKCITAQRHIAEKDDGSISNLAFRQELTKGEDDKTQTTGVCEKHSSGEYDHWENNSSDNPGN